MNKKLKNRLFMIGTWLAVMFVVFIACMIMKTYSDKFDRFISTHSDSVYLYNGALVKVKAIGEVTDEIRETLVTESGRIGDDYGSFTGSGSRDVFKIVTSDNFKGGDVLSDAKLLNILDRNSGNLSTEFLGSGLFFDMYVLLGLYALLNLVLWGLFVNEYSKARDLLSDMYFINDRLAHLNHSILEADMEFGTDNEYSNTYREDVERHTKELEKMERNILVRLMNYLDK